jgi:hypothetical protein
MAKTEPTQRDRHLWLIAAHGRMAWQKASGYTKRARAEAAIARWKQVIGNGLRSRTDERRAIEVAVAPLPSTAWSSWEPQVTAVLPDPYAAGVIAPTPLIRAPRRGGRFPYEVRVGRFFSRLHWDKLGIWIPIASCCAKAFGITAETAPAAPPHVRNRQTWSGS